MTKAPSEKSEASRERRRQAAEEGAKALAEYEANDIAVRKNMARLRELRLAKRATMQAESAVKPARQSRKT
jgi:hypothetical protein